MKSKRVIVASSAVALILILSTCFVAQMYEQNIFSYTFTEDPANQLEIHSGLASYMAVSINHFTLPGLPTAMTAQAPNVSQINQPLINATRGQIYEYISQKPGLQFRALCSGLLLPVGLVEYHLGVLVRAGLVSFIRDGRYKRFFVSNRFSKWEMLLICLLRHQTAKKIIQTLLSKRQLSHSKLASEVSITSQALTWQMKTLGNTEFMLQVNEGLKTIYSLDAAYTPTLQKYIAIVE